jgi:periplasmic divalent cation tolerance protein
MSTDHIVILVTCADNAQARAIAGAVLETHLVACVNIVPQIRSLYWWEGAIQDEQELLCIIKTRADKFEAVRRAVAAVHPYEVPEIIALPMEHGHRPYLDWIDNCVK